MKTVLEVLKKLQDKKYAEFQSKLIPTIDENTIIGVRTAELKKLAKEKPFDVERFLGELPHRYFDENQLHIFILSEMKDFDACIKRVEKFLPYIDNWATCDQLSPKCFNKHKEELLIYINKWIKSKKAYIIRFAIGMLMKYFLDDEFHIKYLKNVADIKYKQSKKIQSKKFSDEVSIKKDPDEYYVEMMRAWFFATALAKQYKATLPYIKDKKLRVWTHNKTIQKAVESYRISTKQKAELQSLREK